MTRRLWSLLVLVFLLVLDVSPMIINSNSSNSIRNNNSNNRTSTTSLSPSSFFKRQKKDWDDFSKLPVELFQNILRFMKKAEDKKELRRTSRRYGGQGSIINNFVFESMAVKITSDDPLSLSDMDVLAGMSKNFRHVSIDHASEFFDIMNEHSNSSPNYYNFSQPALAVLEMPHLNSLRLNFDIALESFDIDQQEREIDDINSDLIPKLTAFLSVNSARLKNLILSSSSPHFRISLGKSLFKLPHLKELTISKMVVDDADFLKPFKKLHTLEVLALDYEEYLELDLVVRDFDVDLPNLQVLTLGQGDRSKLDMQLTRPHPSVKRLYGRQFHENAVQSLQHFPNMDYLDLPYLRNMNLIKFGWMPKLRELVVNLMFLNDRLDNGDEDIVQDDEDDITSITEKLEFICHFSKSLETVSINNVDDLAPFSCLSQLKELVVLEDDISIYFKNHQALSALTHLEVLGSVFDGMSEHNLSIIKDLKLLKQLSLSGTSGILNLESSLIHLVNLEYLTVENIHEPAPITDLSFLSGMQKLNTLILSTNGITQSVLDSTMPALESLMVIDLRDNDGIKEFKRENGKFPKLVNVIL